MPTSIPLSKIKRINLRDCWENEATDFTPWLASEENIALLADALGFDELEVKAQEEHVGPFRADILCVDPGTDKLVLIENQLAKTDHSHLGQIITYAAGLEAVTIVWIAENFTEEHRAAIDWLNSISYKDFNFFGIEIQLIKIDDSPAAPMFNIIAKPNDWSKNVRNSANSSNENLTDTQIYRYEYWSNFCEYMQNNPSKLFKTPAPSKDQWMSIAIGKSAFKIVLKMNTQENLAVIQLYMSDDQNKQYFDELFKRKDEAENAIGKKLEWRRLDEKKTSTIDLSMKINVRKPANYNTIFSWYKEYTEKFVSYFKPIIKTL